jgi:serine/threonine-protein kinase
MSPEQVNGQRLDQRSDIYSLGVTCYHLLAGAAPFQGETALIVAVKHVNEQAIPLSTRRADLPRALCDTIHKMMAKNPADRYQSCAALLEDLDRLARSTDQAAERSSDGGRRWPLAAGQKPQTRGWTRSLIRRLPRRTLWTVTACLLAGVTSAAVGWWLRPGNPLEMSTPAESGFPRQETAQAQFYLAQRLVDDEAAWRAVIDYFPAAKLESRRAKEHLALVLLRDRRFDEAQALFEELAAEDNDDDASRTRGLAGLAALASIEEDYQKSQRIISLELLPLRQFLDERTRDLVLETVRRNQQYGSDQLEQGLEELLRSAPESTDEIRNSG